MPDELVTRLEEATLGARVELTRDDVSRRAGVDVQRADRVWRALGFVSTEPQDRAFAASDADALGLIAGLIESGEVDEADLLGLARTAGATMSRLGEAAVEAFAHRLQRLGKRPGDADGEDVGDLARLLPVFDTLIVHVWHRHLLAAVVRTLGAETGGGRRLAVGFADLVGFTRLSRTLEEAELLELLERFESDGGQVVARSGGRVVKTAGDALLFIAPTAAAAAEIALELVEMGGSGGMPALHVGVAYGEVLLRQGDVAGSVVNVAARLSELARPGTVLVDRGAADELAGVPQVSVPPIRQVRVRGYDHLAPHVLRRAAAEVGG